MHVSDSEIDAAVAAGALSPLDAHGLRQFVATRRATPPPIASDRHFRYRGSAGGVGVAIGVLAASAGLGAVLLATVGPLGGVPVAAAAAILARRFAERREGAATTALFVVFALGVAIAVMGLLGITAKVSPSQGLIIAGSCALASFGFWKLLRLPLAYTAGVIATLTLGDHVLALVTPHAAPWLVTGWMLVSAVIVFAVAMWWDMTDVYRQTIRSDIAWWLHGIAAFKLCASGIRAVIGVRGEAAGWDALWLPPAAITPGAALCAALLFVVYAVVAVAIDRRPLALFGILLLVPILTGLFGPPIMPVALLVAGGLAITAALRWTRWRERVLPLFPGVLRAQLPRVRADPPLTRPVA